LRDPRQRRPGRGVGAAALIAAGVIAAVAPGHAEALRLFHLDRGDEHFTSSTSISGIAALQNGEILLAYRDQVYRRARSGRWSVFAGSFDTGPSLGDGGPATQARLDAVKALATAADGSVLIASRSLIRRVGADGTISTVAGSTEEGFARFGYGGDGGPATAALLSTPEDVAALPTAAS
jgi:hypothetical protein